MNALAKDMKDYVIETPVQALANIEQREALTKPLVDLFLQKPYRRMVVVASGSSNNASHIARPFVQKHLGVTVSIVPPFTFAHYEHDLADDDFVVCVSQSGCSTNTIDALRTCRRLGIPAIGITGNPNSDFKTEADVVIDWGVKEELVGYVTKGVVTLALFFDLFALEAAKQLNRITPQDYDRLLDELRTAMELHPQMVKAFEAHYAEHRKSYLSMSNLYCVSCGSNIGTVMEGALKVGETVHVPSMWYEVDEYIHGPNLQLTPNYTVVFVDGNDEPSKRCVEAYLATREITDRCFIITNRPEADDAHAIRVPSTVSEEITPLYQVVYFQLLAHSVSTELGSLPRHPLMDEFKKRIANKSESYVDHHDELIAKVLR